MLVQNNNSDPIKAGSFVLYTAIISIVFLFIIPYFYAGIYGLSFLKIHSVKIGVNSFTSTAKKNYWAFFYISVAIALTNMLYWLLFPPFVRLIIPSPEYLSFINRYGYHFATLIVNLLFIFAYPLAIVGYFSNQDLRPIRSSFIRVFKNLYKIRLIIVLLLINFAIIILLNLVLSDELAWLKTVFLPIITTPITFVILIYSYLLITEHFNKDLQFDFNILQNMMKNKNMNSEEYDLHFSNMSVYDHEAKKINIPLKDFLNNNIGLEEEIINDLLTNRDPNTKQDQISENPSTINSMKTETKKTGSGNKTTLLISFALIGVVLLCFFISLGMPMWEAFNKGRDGASYWSVLHDIQEWSIAFEKYHHKNKQYPVSNSVNELRKILRPFHLGEFPLSAKDSWEENYIIESTKDYYMITSKGKDKKGGHEYGGSIDSESMILSTTLKDGVYVQYLNSRLNTVKEYEIEIAKFKIDFDNKTKR
jgi:hypothetical protein